MLDVAPQEEIMENGLREQQVVRLAMFHHAVGLSSCGRFLQFRALGIDVSEPGATCPS